MVFNTSAWNRMDFLGTSEASHTSGMENSFPVWIEPIVKSRKGIIWLQKGKVVLYSEDVRQSDEVTAVSKFLLFSHQIIWNPSYISLEDIQVAQVNGEIFLIILWELYYFSEFSTELISLWEYFWENAHEFSFLQVQDGIIVQKWAKALLKLQNSDFFYELPLFAWEKAANYQDWFLKTIDSHTLTQREVHLDIQKWWFFVIAQIQEQIDACIDDSKKNLLFEQNREIIDERISYFVESYWANEGFSTRLNHGKVQVHFFWDVDTQWHNLQDIETQIARLICIERAKNIYGEAFPDAQVSASFYWAKLIATCEFWKNSKVSYDAGILWVLSYPEDSLLLDSEDVDRYKNIFYPQKDEEKYLEKPHIVPLYSFLEYEFILENWIFKIYKNRATTWSLSSTLDISLHPTSCTESQLYSFMWEAFDHKFEICAGHLFFTLSYPDTTQIVYRFSPEEGVFKEEFHIKSKKNVNIRETYENASMPGFIMWHKMQISRWAWIFLGEKQKLFFSESRYTSEYSKVKESPAVVHGLDFIFDQPVSHTDASSQELFDIQMFQNITTISNGKDIFAIMESWEKNKVTELSSEWKYYIIWEDLYITQWFEDGKKVLKKSNIALWSIKDVVFYQEDDQIGLLNLGDGVSQGYIFRSDSEDFEKVHADIRFFWKIGEWRFVSVDGVLYALENKDGMLVKIHLQDLPQNVISFVVLNDLWFPALDIQLSEKNNIQRYYFDAVKGQFSHDSLSQRPSYQFWHPSGDVQIGVIWWVKLLRNGDNLVFHTGTSIKTSSIIFTGKLEIHTICWEDIIFWETFEGSWKYEMYRYDSVSKELILLWLKEAKIPDISTYSFEEEFLVVENGLLSSQSLLYTFDVSINDFILIWVRDSVSGKEIMLSGLKQKGRAILKVFASWDFIFFETYYGSWEYYCKQFREQRFARDLDGIFIQDEKGNFTPQKQWIVA